MVYAVKTCGKNHDSRVAAVLRTWGRNLGPDLILARLDCTTCTAVAALLHCSDTPDPVLGTVALGGVEPVVSPGPTNADLRNKGYFGLEKSLAVVRHFLQLDGPVADWLVLVDDDTVLRSTVC